MADRSRCPGSVGGPGALGDGPGEVYSPFDNDDHRPPTERGWVKARFPPIPVEFSLVNAKKGLRVVWSI